MPSSLEIAQEAELRPIAQIAEALGLSEDEYDPYGRYKAKVSLSVLDRLSDQPDGKLIDVTAITPTKAGEGKTTLGDLNLETTMLRNYFAWAGGRTPTAPTPDAPAAVPPTAGGGDAKEDKKEEPKKEEPKKEEPKKEAPKKK